MAYPYYYNTNVTPGEVVDKTWVAFYGGIDPDTATPEELSAVGFYCWIPGTQPGYNPLLKQLNESIDIIGTDAIQSYTVSDLPLSTVKLGATSYEKQQAAILTARVRQQSGYCEDILTATASKVEIDRDPSIQSTLKTQNAYVDRMVSNISAINAATNVEEISTIIYAPIGVLNTGRGGPGQAGPEDLNLSYLVSLSLPYTVSELELFIPGTGTVIPYDSGLPEPYQFDSMGNCFAVGDYTLQVRVADTGFVLGATAVSEGANTDVGFS